MDIVSDVKLHLQLVNLWFVAVGTIGIGGGGKQKITGGRRGDFKIIYFQIL